MEFHEKLQQLRKSRSLTQEQLAEALFVSRTAVSKWESGRGYPNIDSLKELARFFSVTIDELICADEIIVAAEHEKKEIMNHYSSLICHLLDVLLVILLWIPAFGNGKGMTVSLFDITGINPLVKTAFIGIIGLTILNGLIGMLVLRMDRPIFNRRLQMIGVCLSIIGVMIFLVTRQPYAGMVTFSFLVLKGILMIRFQEAHR